VNTKEYIESGIIESYILGDVSAQEKQEVECMAHIYPEIKEELQRTEAALESYARSFGAKTRDGLKTKIFAAIEKESKATTQATNNEAKVVPLSSNNRDQKNIRFWKYSAAAGFALFLTTSAFLIIQKGKYEGQSDKLASMNRSLDSTQKKLAGMSTDMNMQNQRLDFYTNPQNKIIAMKGLEKKDPSSLALICWNTESKDVFIDVKNLPQAPEGMQYQLWAIVDGKPVDLGVMDTSDSKPEFHKMKAVEAPQAFAVTLEKKGGSPVPTMEEMYVIGNV
jgi:anti-sigma-K factor RskA